MIMSNSRLSEKDKPVGRTVLLTPELGCAKPLTRPYAKPLTRPYKTFGKHLS